MIAAPWPRAFLRRIVRVEDREIPAMLWGFAQMFFLLAGNYVFRSVRESLGSARGSQDYKWLYLGTFAATFFTSLAWSAIVARVPVRRFVAIAHQFFAVSFLAFWAMFQFSADARAEDRIGHAFFVWYSVYNLFIISVFWSRAADLFTHEQGRRLFPFVAAGASIGAIAGSAITRTFVEAFGTINLLLVPVVLLQISLYCARRLGAAAAGARAADAGAVAGPEAPPVKKDLWSGLRQTFASPFLALIATYLLFSTFCGTFVYNMSGDLSREAYPLRDERTEYYATIDLAVNVLAFLAETLLTARLLKWIGVGAALMILPAVYVVGFTMSGLLPVLATVATLEIARRSVGYGITTSAREVLFTVVPREAKYKAKNVIDTFVWRGGDAAAVWFIALLLQAGGWSHSSSATKVMLAGFAGIPIALLWIWAAAKLRALHRREAAASATTAP